MILSNVDSTLALDAWKMSDNNIVHAATTMVGVNVYKCTPLDSSMKIGS